MLPNVSYDNDGNAFRTGKYSSRISFSFFANSSNIVSLVSAMLNENSGQTVTVGKKTC